MAKTTESQSSPAAPIDSAPSGFKTYLIEKNAPPWIAGKRVPEGVTEIDLTDDQALMELLSGHIWPKGVDRKPAAPTDGSTSA